MGASITFPGEPINLYAPAGLGALATVKTNLTATTNPAVGNDNTQGYAAGSLWFNTLTPAVYECISAATGAAVWSLLSGGLPQMLDVRSFGNWANGVDCTTTWLAAVTQINSNASSGTGPTALYLPPITPTGTTGPIIQMNGYQVSNANIIPSNVTGCANFSANTSLIGGGPGSVLSFGFANQQNGVQYYFGFFHNSNFMMRDISIDGNKSHFTNTTGQSSVQFFGVFPFTTGVNNCLFQNVTVHDIPAAGVSESFGLCLWSGANDCVFLNCRGYNCVGTPIHILGGSTLITNQCYNIRIIGGSFFANTFQGVSDYNSTNVQYVGARAFNNGISGFNSEMSSNAQYIGCISYDNHNGYSVLGLCQNIQYWDCYSGASAPNSDPLAGANQNCEFNLNTSTFVLSAQLANATPQGPIEIRNCKVFPASGKPHIQVTGANTASGSLASSYVSSLGGTAFTTPEISKGPVLLDVPDVDTWVIWDQAAGNATTMARGLKIPVRLGMRPTVLGPLNNSGNWTATTLTQGANNIVNPIGGNPISLSCPNTGAGTYVSGYLLLAKRAYLLRWRCNQQDINATWQIVIREQTSGTVLYSQALTSNNAVDRAIWYENAYVISTGTTNPARIELSVTATPSATSVSNWDYVSAYEIERGGSLSEATT